MPDQDWFFYVTTRTFRTTGDTYRVTNLQIKELSIWRTAMEKNHQRTTGLKEILVLKKATKNRILVSKVVILLGKNIPFAEDKRFNCFIV